MGTFCSKSKKKGNPHSPRSKVSEGSRAPALIVIHTLLRRTHSGMDSRNPVTWSWISACEHCLNQPLTQRQVTVSFGFAQGKPDTGCIRNILIPYPSGSKAVLRLSCRCVLPMCPASPGPFPAGAGFAGLTALYLGVSVYNGKGDRGNHQCWLTSLTKHKWIHFLSFKLNFSILSLISRIQAWFWNFKLDFGISGFIFGFQAWF